MAELARAADRRIQGAEPGVRALCQAGGPGRAAADRERQADQARRPDSRIPAIVAVLQAGGYLPDNDQAQPQGAVKHAGRCGRTDLHACARRGRQAVPVGFGGQARWRSRPGDDRRAQHRPGRARASARGRDGAAALASAQSGRDADRRQHGRVVPRLLARRRSTSTTARSSTAKATSRRRSLQAPIFQLVAKPTWTVPKGIGEKELADKSPGLSPGQWLRSEGRPVRPAVGPEEFARPGQVRHEGRRGHLPPRHAGQVGVRAVRPAPQPRLRPRRECDAVRDGARAAGRHSRQVPEGDAGQRRQCLREAAEGHPCPAALPHGLLGRLAHPVSPRRLWLGREYRQGAGTRARTAAEDPAAGKQRQRRRP